MLLLVSSTLLTAYPKRALEGTPTSPLPPLSANPTLVLIKKSLLRPHPHTPWIAFFLKSFLESLDRFLFCFYATAGILVSRSRRGPRSSSSTRVLKVRGVSSRGGRFGRLLRRLFGREGWGFFGGDAPFLAAGVRYPRVAVWVRGGCGGRGGAGGR